MKDFYLLIIVTFSHYNRQ